LQSLHQGYARLMEAADRAAQAEWGSRLVALAAFGSVARGTPRFDSDLDLLAVLSPAPAGRYARWLEAEEVKRRCAPTLAELTHYGLAAELSLLIKSEEQLEAGFPLLLDMVEDAHILEDSSGVLAKRLQRLSERLKAAGARRIWTGNAWHWDLGSGEFEL
jgi:hypothetical protein